jgi:hypothetical protein
MDAAAARLDDSDALPDHSAQPSSNGRGTSDDDLIPRIVLESRCIADKRYVPMLRIVGWEHRPLTARKLVPPPLPLPPTPKANAQGELGLGGFEKDDSIPF